MAVLYEVLPDLVGILVGGVFGLVVWVLPEWRRRRREREEWQREDQTIHG